MSGVIVHGWQHLYNRLEVARQEYEAARVRWIAACNAWQYDRTSHTHQRLESAKEERREAWRRYQEVAGQS